MIIPSRMDAVCVLVEGVFIFLGDGTIVYYDG